MNIFCLFDCDFVLSSVLDFFQWKSLVREVCKNCGISSGVILISKKKTIILYRCSFQRKMFNLWSFCLYKTEKKTKQRRSKLWSFLLNNRIHCSQYTFFLNVQTISVIANDVQWLSVTAWGNVFILFLVGKFIYELINLHMVYTTLATYTQQ